MKDQKLCLSLNGDFGLSNPDQIRLFKKTGFEAFTGHWNVGYDEDIKECARVGKEENMIFQSFHAPWNHTADMWDEENDY